MLILKYLILAKKIPQRKVYEFTITILMHFVLTFNIAKNKVKI